MSIHEVAHDINHNRKQMAAFDCSMRVNIFVASMMKQNIEQCIDKTRIDLNSSWTDVKARIKRNECIQIHIQKHEN